MKTILFPTDFSENAFNAIKYGLELYKNEPSKFILLNAYHVNNYVEGSAFEGIPKKSTLEDAKKLSDKKLKELKNELEGQNNNPQQLFEVISKNYTLIDAINDQLEKKDIEVIIIGTQGNTTKYDLDYGSNTIAILENIKNCPILAVPRNERFTGLKEIVLANGYKTSFEATDFNYLINISKSNKSPIRVLHISETGGLNQSQKEKKELLKTYLKATETSFHMLEHVSVPVGIYCFSESRNSDMISFVNKKYTFIEKLFFKPLYKNLGHYAKIPVLVLHKNNYF